MTTRDDLQDWVVEALKHHDGEATILDVAKHVWSHHEEDLRQAGDLFYTWQYDLRWAATKLRKLGILEQTEVRSRQPWRLA